MIKITKKLITEIIKLNNPTDEDYRVLLNFLNDNVLTNLIEDSLYFKALKKYNQKEV